MRHILNTPGYPTPPRQAQPQAPDIDTCCGPDVLNAEHVARMAYFNYIANGSSDGNDVRDWLDAESRLHIDDWSVPDDSENSSQP